jgi:hypothetical protein
MAQYTTGRGVWDEVISIITLWLEVALAQRKTNEIRLQALRAYQHLK